MAARHLSPELVIKHITSISLTEQSKLEINLECSVHTYECDGEVYLWTPVNYSAGAGSCYKARYKDAEVKEQLPFNKL